MSAERKRTLGERRTTEVGRVTNVSQDASARSVHYKLPTTNSKLRSPVTSHQSPLLEVSGVTKRFGGITALNECAVRVEKGTITAIIGPNGSGKSTLFHTISGLMKADKGEITFDQHSITNKRVASIARRGIARTFQDVRLFRNLTVKDHLDLALNTTDEGVLKSFFTKKQDNKKRIAEVLLLVGFNNT